MAVNEVSASLGLIVAAPTAGACGVLPGALFAAAEDLGVQDNEDALIDALLAAGAVGAVFAQRATFLAELCGCQVESGAGAAMAAAAVVEMRGGTPRQALDAASISLQNILGMECDPVAGLMEVPCINRNALGAVNALMSADIVLAGVDSVIPFDEVVDAVYETGRFRPVQCNGTGGLATTPTGRALRDHAHSMAHHPGA
jgi:L-serine dehydratase